MRITQHQVSEFAQWTGDCNPIHVDPVAAKESAFGGVICHGALVLIEAFRNWDVSLVAFPAPLKKVEIQFRGPVKPGAEYDNRFQLTESGISGRVESSGQPLLDVQAYWDSPSQSSPPVEINRDFLQWMNRAKSSGIRSTVSDTPAIWKPEDFVEGQEILGSHAFADHTTAKESRFSLLQEQIFGLCSFIVGMKVPGLSSLFTRLSVDFISTPKATTDLLYKLTLESYDENFRILEMKVEIATGNMIPVAICRIGCYVRFTSSLTPLALYASHLKSMPLVPSRPKIAVICGASRGLGSELAIALAACGYKIYLISRSHSTITEAIIRDVRSSGGVVEVLLGDLGNHSFCGEIAKQVRDQDGMLHYLVLNACEPPIHSSIQEGQLNQSLEYVSRNIPLFRSPLQALMPLVSETRGCVVGISSAFVEEMPSGFSDYISVKTALEATLSVAAKENKFASFLIARPPKLQTSWNDTPTAALGTKPIRDVALKIVQQATAFADRPEADRLDNLKIICDFPTIEWVAKSPPASPDLIVTLVSNFTLDPIQQAFPGLSQFLGKTIHGNIAPYNQILQELLNPQSAVSKTLGGGAILLRISDWIRELSDAQRRDFGFVQRYLQDSLLEFIRAVRQHRNLAKGPTLILVCPSKSNDLPERLSEYDMVEQLKAELAEVPGVAVWWATDYHSKYSVPEDTVYDLLRDEIGHIPYTDDYYLFLGTLVTRYFFRQLSLPKKVVVLDCDNTLWGGVVGELGAAGISISPSHEKLHAKLNELVQGGVLLCLCSKNEPEDVWQVFEKRSDFCLPRQNIVAAKINWLPKSQNIQELATDLNLGLDSFIFLDDNPVECAEVQTSCPSVLTLPWPHDSEIADRFIDHLWEWDLGFATKEDRERNRMYQQELERKSVQKGAASFQEFIDSLQLVVDFKRVSPQELTRASQLTLRTNQFNLTTRRRNEAEIQELIDNPNFDVLILNVRDRFGDYGMVGLFIASVESERPCYDVDTFLLSCRVLGRGVEHRIVAEVARRAMERGCEDVRWSYIPTQKNRPARMFVEKTLGLSVGEDPSFQGTIKASELIALQYRPIDENETDTIANEESRVVSTKTESLKTVNFRERERQIQETIEHFSRFPSISRRLLGNQRSPNHKSFHTRTEESLEDRDEKRIAEDSLNIEQIVLQAFSEALRKSPEKIRELNRLDNLGCDSLQIVGITVALSRSIPNLPPTLLFEHRSVTEIIQQISGLQRTSNRSNENRSKTRINAVDGNPDIAIVGMSANTAAGLELRSLWELLVRGESKVARVPNQRQDYAGSLASHVPYFAGLLPSISAFDPEFFGISPREAQYMDPQMRMLLESAWHAIEDAGGFRPEIESSTGIFIGYMYQCYGRFANPIAVRNASVFRCWEGFSFANRISQFLGVSGPSLAIDTACSSSATALHFACDSIRKGDCKAAIVGGVNAIVDPSRIVQLGNLGILSPTGHCVPFGDGADGTVIGEGAVCIMLKPLSDALENGDRIYAVIKGTGLSAGAGSVGFTAPNPIAQSIAIRNALSDSKVDPRTIGYVETHGTGTQLGDPIEVRGLEMAYCDLSLWDDDIECNPRTAIGSIKPNIGHLEAGAGLMGVVKAALQLHHKMLLHSISSDRPNPQIPFSRLPFEIQRQTMPWQPLKVYRRSSGSVETLPRRAAVNSFGVGGSNAHIVLEEAPFEFPKPPSLERSTHILVLQAPTEESLQRQASNWASFLLTQPKEKLGDITYSSRIGRKSHEFRALLVVDDPVDAANSLRKWSKAKLNPLDHFTEANDICWSNKGWNSSNRVALLFTGQGVQYTGMLRELYEESPLFRESVERCAREADHYLDISILEVLFGGIHNNDTRIHQTRYTQPSLFITQYALFRLWESYGVIPNFVLGHSIGEIAAYCVTGGCSLQDAIRLVTARGELMQRLPLGGGMSSISASAEWVDQLIADSAVDLSIAAFNGPNQTVVSGPLEEIEKFVTHAHKAGIKTQALKVSHAFHSKLMEPMLDEFRSVVAGLKLGTPSVEFLSTVTGQTVQYELSNPEYWVEQVRKPVRFMQSMQSLCTKGISHYLEIGPHPVLTTMARSMDLPCVDESTRWLASAQRGRKDWRVFLQSVSDLFVDGYPIDWKSSETGYQRQRTYAPEYRFSNRRIWLNEIDAMKSSQINSTEHPGEKAANSATSRSGTRLMYRVDWIKQTIVNGPSDLGPTGKAPVATPSETADTDKTRWLILAVGDPSFGSKFTKQLGEHDLLSRLIVWDEELQDWGIEAKDYDGFEHVLLTVGFGQNDLLGQNQIQEQAETYIRAFSKALSLAKQSKSPEKRKILWLITQNPEGSGETPSIAPQTGHLWGGARVAGIEMPEIWGGIIAVDDSVATAIAIIQSQTTEDQVIVRSDDTWVPRLRRIPSIDCTSENSKQENHLGESVLITGGLGAIGLRLAEYAVANGAKRLTLVNRTATPGPEQQSRLRVLQDSGVDVQCVIADVSTIDGMASLEMELHGKRIDAVFHTAGVDFQAPLCEWSDQDVHTVTQAKIQGTWNLHHWSLSHPIKTFVFTSSIASVWGAPNRFLYACANAFLDSFAQWRLGQGLPATVFNFGPWDQGGMADTSSLKEYQRVGMNGLAPEETLVAIDLALREKLVNVVITDTQWDRFVSVMSARRPRPLFDDVVGTGGETNVAEIAAANGNSSCIGKSIVPQKKITETLPWVSRLRKLKLTEQIAELQQLVRNELSQVLQIETDRVGFDRNLYRLGLDSITAVEFSIRLQRSTGVFPGRFMAGEPTIYSIAEAILSGLHDQLTTASPEPDLLPDQESESSDELDTNTQSKPEAYNAGILQIPPDQNPREFLIRCFAEDLEQFVGKSKVPVSASSPMTTLGLDSLGTVDFATHLRKKLGLPSHPRLMRYPTVGEWVDSVVAQLPVVQSSLAAGSTVAVVSEDTSTIDASADANNFAIKHYDPSKHARVIDFCSKAWPQRDPDLLEKRWDWMFLESASRLGTPPKVWLAEHNSKIIGHMGAQFTRLQLGEKEITTAWLVDTMVLKNFRQQGVGAQIMLQAEEDMPIAVSLGQTAEIRRILTSLGWKKVCPLNIYIFMNNPFRVLRGKFPKGLDRMVAVYFGIKRRRKQALIAKDTHSITLRRIDRFSKYHDSLWDQMKQAAICTAVRDSSFLNWKYIDQPGQQYDCWEVLRSGNLAGVLVTKTEEASDVYTYRRLHVVDLVSGMDRGSIASLIQGCVTKSKELKADAVSFQITSDSVEPLLKKHGFLRRPETRYFYISRGLAEAYRDSQLAPWFLTQGDSDIDRP